MFGNKQLTNGLSFKRSNSQNSNLIVKKWQILNKTYFLQCKHFNKPLNFTLCQHNSRYYTASQNVQNMQFVQFCTDFISFIYSASVTDKQNCHMH